MELHNLQYTKGSRGHKRRNYGRGFSSGLGKTSGRGQKGQHSRKSGNVRIGFEGGQTPIYRKIPKVGFNSYNFKTNYHIVSLDMIVRAKLTDITRESLIKKGLISSANLPIKLIGPHDYSKIKDKFNIEVNAITKPLKTFLEKNGSQVKVVEFTKVKPTKSKTKKETKKPAVKTTTAKPKTTTTKKPTAKKTIKKTTK